MSIRWLSGDLASCTADRLYAEADGDEVAGVPVAARGLDDGRECVVPAVRPTRAGSTSLHRAAQMQSSIGVLHDTPDPSAEHDLIDGSM